MKYMRKPFYVDANVLTRENQTEMERWSGAQAWIDQETPTWVRGIVIHRPEADVYAGFGDYIVQLPDQTFTAYEAEAFEEEFVEFYER